MSNRDDAGDGDSDFATVTLCAWTRTVRHEGEWISVEKYLQRRFGILTSHGVSPDGMAILVAGVGGSQPSTAEMAPVQQSVVDNPRRLAAVRATGLLDSPRLHGFDRLTRIGAQLLGVRTTFISLVDTMRDFYLSDYGFGEPLASARELAGQTFCHFTIQGEAVLAIPDTKADPVYRNVPTVKSLGIAAYLGAPLVLLSGEVIGAFCAVDQVPRAWTEPQMQNARDIASLVVSEIELRQSSMNVRSVRV